MKLLLGTQYFVYFAVRGIVLPFFNLFCHHLGFSGFQIGILSSVQTASIMIFPVLWAMAADRFDARKPIFLICTVMSSLFWSLLFFTDKFLPILCILAIYSVFYAPIISFLEAFAMDILGKDKKKYGKSRVWGTISFIVVSLIMGKTLSVYPTTIVIPLIFGGMVVQSIFSFKMPDIKIVTKQNSLYSSSTTPVSIKKSGYMSSWSDFRLFFSYHTTLFLIAAFLMLLSHGAYYGFFSIYLESLGFNTGFIGFAWAVASIAEVVVMVGSGKIFSRFNIKTVLVVSCMAACLRWFMLFTTALNFESFNLAPNFFGSISNNALIILISQLFHALTYGSFHIASILAIDRLSLKGTTFGQAVNNAVTYGAGMMTGFFLSGIFYDDFQKHIFLVSSLIAFAGGIIILYVQFDSKEI